MIKLDHLTILVRDTSASRDWYVRHFGFEVEFEALPHTVALKDDAGLTLFLSSGEGDFEPSCGLFFQVDDVGAKHEELSAHGVAFEKAPQKLFWGYGAELRDPDGYRLHLWDQRSMREKG